MILFFSGTGNSRYAAELISKITDDELVSMNERIKKKSITAISSKNPFVFVVPVYAGRIPRIVEKHIMETNFAANKNAYFILTCAQTPWITANYVEKLCAKKGLTLLGCNSVVMPQNYIAHSDILPDGENDKIIETATPKIQKIAEAIKEGKSLPKEEPGKSMMSKVLNPIMYAMMVNARKFYASEKCKGCGQCTERCALNNIRMENKKPQWGKDCTHCMACIGGCQNKAIENGKVTVGRNRYYNKKTHKI